MLFGSVLLLAFVHARPPLPPISREFRAAWVATVDNIDWPNKRGEPVETQKRELVKIVDTAAKLHLNALIFQVRPSADSLYPNSLEPWSEYLTGRQGQAPRPNWDPLEFVIHEAHLHGIELHAWFNPYRAESPAQKGPNCAEHVSATHPDVVKKYGPFLWMDPGEPWVQHHSLAVILDVVKRYNVDGVHIDDYFYPYKELSRDHKPMDFPDGASWGKYVRSGGKLSRDDWRRQNVDTFVQNLYDQVKATKRWVKVGISPFGIYRPGIPEGIRAGVDQYAELYADCRKWLQNGWCDYITPQLYWPINQKAQAYGTLLNWWVSANTDHRHIWPGNYTSRVDPAVGKWDPNEVLSQIRITRDTHPNIETYVTPKGSRTPDPETGATGNVHFSMRVFLRNSRLLDDGLEAGPYRALALVPESGWLAKGPGPAAPRVATRGQLRPQADAAEYLWTALDGKSWEPWQATGSPEVPPSMDGRAWAVVCVDRTGRVSPPLFSE